MKICPGQSAHKLLCAGRWASSGQGPLNNEIIFVIHLLKLEISELLVCEQKHHIIPHNNSWTEVKVLLHDVQQLPLALLGGSIRKDGDRDGMGNTDSVGYLKELLHIMHTYNKLNLRDFNV